MRGPTQNESSGGWYVQTWVAFVLSLGAMCFAIVYAPLDIWPRAFLGLGLFFTISATVSLSKAVRDRHESEKLLSKIEEARTESVLREMDRAA